ncbi:unnamed protein product [Didymodactylos carnosus]|uniref:Uncharacterized protein n=1 Tax=Didymodactylos carnosus TaxID=1234261 RepID=A0A814WEU3_9BILA|nr:unnamed protein product [Didymodactylos carnosus]CAF3965997.1 unnamed protein product [Didymodactylos carnosus]
MWTACSNTHNKWINQMAPVSQLSCLWFGTNERTRATCIAILSASFGCTIGFVISPYIVDKPDHVPYLLYLHVGLSFLSCILAIIYFPAVPPTPPSPAAELLIYSSNSGNQNGINSLKIYLSNVWQCLTCIPFLLLSLAGGIFEGTFTAWNGLFATILTPMHYTETQAGWFGFGFAMATMIGGLIVSTMADSKYFQRLLKLLILISLFCSLLCCLWFQLSVRTIFSKKPILKPSTVSIGLSLAFTGLFQGAANPLIYECLAEIMYPLPESLSASILVEWINIIVLIFLFIAPDRTVLMNFLVLLTTFLSIIMILFVKIQYKRRDEDERKKLEKQQETVEDINIYIRNRQQQHESSTT